MIRAPLTRERSEWIERQTNYVEGVQTRWLSRNVSDGTLWSAIAEEPHGWHMSISFRDHRGRLSRYPRWDEIAHARDHLLPDDVDFVLWLPRSEDYVALHDTTFHLHEHPPRGRA